MSEQVSIPPFGATQIAERLLAIAKEHREKDPLCACDLAHNVEMYANSLGSLGAAVQAFRLTPEAYSRLLLLIGNASYTSTVPTQDELEGAINGR